MFVLTAPCEAADRCVYGVGVQAALIMASHHQREISSAAIGRMTVVPFPLKTKVFFIQFERRLTTTLSECQPLLIGGD